MGHILIKPFRDEDKYVYWSTMVEAPIGYGNREEMARLLAEEMRRSWTPSDPPEERLQRADVYGSSSIGYGTHPPYVEGWWDDQTYIYEQRGILHRSKLYEAAALCAVGLDSQVWDLLEPFEGETEVRRG